MLSRKGSMLPESNALRSSCGHNIQHCLCPLTAVDFLLLLASSSFVSWLVYTAQGDWMKCWDPRERQYYYHNLKTQKTDWDAPPIFGHPTHQHRHGSGSSSSSSNNHSSSVGGGGVGSSSITRYPAAGRSHSAPGAIGASSASSSSSSSSSINQHRQHPFPQQRHSSAGAGPAAARPPAMLAPGGSSARPSQQTQPPPLQQQQQPGPLAGVSQEAKIQLQLFQQEAAVDAAAMRTALITAKMDVIDEDLKTVGVR
jgi:hypothetical protein